MAMTTCALSHCEYCQPMTYVIIQNSIKKKIKKKRKAQKLSHALKI